MLSRCHTQRSSGLHDSWVMQDDTSTRSLIVTRWISPNLAQPHRYEHTIWRSTQESPSISSKHVFLLFPKNPIFPILILTLFFVSKTLCNNFWSVMSNRVLSILAGFIIQTEQIIFRDKPRLSRNGYKNQGVAIQPGSSSKSICSFVKQTNRLCL